MFSLEGAKILVFLYLFFTFAVVVSMVFVAFLVVECGVFILFVIFFKMYTCRL